MCFEFPEGSAQNGRITSFNVTLVGFPFDTEPQTIGIPVRYTDYPLTGSMCGDLFHLQENNNYTVISVELINYFGSGPSSSFSSDVRTLQAGKQFMEAFHKYCLLHLTCSRLGFLPELAEFICLILDKVRPNNLLKYGSVLGQVIRLTGGPIIWSLL